MEIEKVILDWIETSKRIFLDEQTNSRQTLESQKVKSLKYKLNEFTKN